MSIYYVEYTPDFRKEWVSYCILGSHFCDDCFLRFKCFISRDKRIYLNEDEWKIWKTRQGMCLETCKFIKQI